MNRLFRYMIIAGMAFYAISCAQPEDPTPTNMSYGDWYVQEYYVDGQLEGSSSSVDVIQRFTLERDGTFILTDENGFVTIGTWTATETTLTLTGQGEGASVYEFQIIFQSYSKMHLLQTISSPSAGAIEIRYLMNWGGDGTTY